MRLNDGQKWSEYFLEPKKLAEDTLAKVGRYQLADAAATGWLGEELYDHEADLERYNAWKAMVEDIDQVLILLAQEVRSA